jgi:hypothetical protein
MLCSEHHKLINYIGNKEKLSQQWNESIIYHFTRRAIKLTIVILCDIIAINFIQNFDQYPSLMVKSICR